MFAIANVTPRPALALRVSRQQVIDAAAETYLAAERLERRRHVLDHLTAIGSDVRIAA